MFKGIIAVLVGSLFLVACGSNKNSLRIHGERCKTDFEPIAVNLQEHKGEDLTPEQKHQNKLFKEKQIEKVEDLDFTDLPVGTYKRKRIEFHIVETLNRGGLHKGGLEIFAYRREASEGEQKKYQKDSIEEFGCIRNMPTPNQMKAGVYYSFDGLVEVVKANEGKTLLKSRNFIIENNGKPESKWTLSGAADVADLDQKPSEYFKGDSASVPTQTASLYKIKDNKLGKNIYELHSEFKTDAYLIQMKTVFQWVEPTAETPPTP